MNEVGLDDLEPPAETTQQSIAMLIGGEVISTAETTSLREAAAIMRDAEVGMVVVGDRDKVIGVVSERDILKAVASGDDLDTTTVGGAASSGRLKWATPDSSVGEVIEEMMEGYVRHILVADDQGSLVGVVSMRDLLAAFPV